jgi:hypothetical protein
MLSASAHASLPAGASRLSPEPVTDMVDEHDEGTTQPG